MISKIYYKEYNGREILTVRKIFLKKSKKILKFFRKLPIKDIEGSLSNVITMPARQCGA